MPDTPNGPGSDMTRHHDADFTDRQEAGRQLSSHLPRLDREDTIVIALPRGGVPVGKEIAARLGLPLDVILVRKVGCPGRPELAVAAVAEGPEPILVINREVAGMAGLSEADIRHLAEPELAEIARRRTLWHGNREPLPVAGKTVIVVDDGIATGATMKAALDALRQAGAARLILAVPVAPASALAEFEPLVDQTVCLHSPCDFVAVGAHYRDFRQVSDREVAEALATQAADQARPGNETQ